MKKYINLIIAALLLGACTGNRTMGPVIKDSFPRLILSKEDISKMRENALSGKQPFDSCYRALLEKGNSVLQGDWEAKPYAGDTGMPFFTACQRDGGMARDLAILWQISRDPSFADAAVKILEAWTDLDEYAGIRINDSICAVI